MTRVITLCWLTLCQIFIIPFASGQENVGAEPTWSVSDLIDIAGSGSISIAGRSECSNCHRGPLANSLQLRRSFVPDSKDPLPLNFSVTASGNALSCGDYLITELSDSLLRSHLRLKDRPALVVVNAPKKEGLVSTLELGDVLIATNNEPVDNALRFRTKMDQDSNAKVKITLLREGKELNQTVTASGLGSPPKLFRLGVQVESPSDAMRSQLNLLEKEGLLVVEILDEPSAKATGLQVHDILLRANDTRLTSPEDLKTSVAKNQGNEIEVTMLRKGKQLVLKAMP